jgi:hypothetical protein
MWTSPGGPLSARSLARWRRGAIRRLRLLNEKLPWYREPPLRFVFVVTYGRSGSTLVQGLLNVLPRTLVRGENNFYIFSLYEAMVHARGFRRQFGKQRNERPTSAFYGLWSLQPGHFDDLTRDLVVKQLLGATERRDVDVIGFKEIRWNQIDSDAQVDFFDFMDRAFPGAQYVLNRRNHGDVKASDFWRGRRPEEFVEIVSRIEEIQNFLRTTRPDRVYDTQYELLTGADDSAVEKQLRGLAEFVTGSCDDALLAELRDTLTVGHGPHPSKPRRRLGAGGEAGSD